MKDKNWYDRLIKNYVTSIAGLLVIIFCGVMLYQEKQTTAQLAGWFSFGMFLLQVKDSSIRMPK